MCILLQVFSFLLIKRRWANYKRKKDLAKAGIVGDPKKKCKYIRNKMGFVTNFFERQKAKHGVLFLKVSTGGTFENFVVMAVVGLVVGVLFSFVYFFSEVYLGEASVFWCFLVRLPLLVAFTINIAFKEMGRSILLLCPVQLFSTSGQWFMKAQLIILVTEGPVMNLRHNVRVIQESGACQQRGAAAAAAEVADILFGPFSSFQEAAKQLIKGIKAMVEKLQKMLDAFKRTVMAVADAVQDATKWINSKINGCKNTVGTTYQHCMDAFSWMYDECKVSVPSIFVKMCSVTEFASNLCSSVKPGEYLCDLVYFNIDPLVTTISQRIRRLMDRAYTLMYFEVHVHHEFRMDTNSKSIAEEIREKLSAINAALTALGLGIWGIISIILKILFLIRVYRYRRSYLRREDFDNYFITKKLRSIDILETLKGEESIFPLRRVEERKYIKVTSVFLTNKESKLFSFPAGVLVKTIFFSLIISLDYLLYNVTNKCRVFMLAMMQSFGSRPEINVQGSGFIGELSRRVVGSLNHMDYNFYYTHFMPCVPNPKPPNSWINKKIVFFLALLWLSWLIQPYVLRFRHMVMDYYHPQSALRRARWLYNSIVFKRITFISVIRMKLKAKYGSRGKGLTIADIIRARCPWTTVIIGKGMLAEECMICHHLKPPLYNCPTKDCVGIYCDDCYVNIRGVCSLCKESIRHSDFNGTEFKQKNKDEILDYEDTDDSKGLFLVYEDENDHFLDFSYQGGLSHLSFTPQTSIDILTETYEPNNVNIDGNSEDENVEEFYSFEGDETAKLLNQPDSKYNRHKEHSRKGKVSPYEDKFEMT